MTTLEFLKDSIGIANGLRGKDVKAGDLVLIIGNNSLNMNVALAGILFLGAVPFPVSSYANAGLHL